MFHFPLIYRADICDFSRSRGANQGEWIFCKASPNLQYIAGKDAGPCILIFMHGHCASDQAHFAAVAHISIAENIDSLSEMCTEMNKKCDQVKVSIISSISKENSDLAKQVITFLNRYFADNCIRIDLGHGTSKAVLEIKTGNLWRQKDIPLENYDSFDADLYFQKAVIGIFDRNRKRALEKTYDNTGSCSQAVVTSREIIVYQPNNMMLFLRYVYMMEWLARRTNTENTQDDESCDNRPRLEKI